MNLRAFILSALCLTVFSPSAFANDLHDAKAALERSDYERALKLLDDALKTMPKGQAAVYEMRAVTQAHRGRADEALADYDQAVRLATGEQPDLLRRIAIGVLSSLLSHDQEFVRGAAVTALADLGPRGIESPLNAALRDKSPRVRGLAIQTAGRLGLAASLPAVREAVKDPDASVRLAALATLGLSKVPAVVPIVKQGLRDHDQLAQLVAREALILLKQPESLQPLVAATRDLSPAVRGVAVGILGRLKEPSALQ